MIYTLVEFETSIGALLYMTLSWLCHHLSPHPTLHTPAHNLVILTVLHGAIGPKCALCTRCTYILILISIEVPSRVIKSDFLSWFQPRVYHTSTISVFRSTTSSIAVVKSMDLHTDIQLVTMYAAMYFIIIQNMADKMAITLRRFKDDPFLR